MKPINKIIPLTVATILGALSTNAYSYAQFTIDESSVPGTAGMPASYDYTKDIDKISGQYYEVVDIVSATEFNTSLLWLPSSYSNVENPGAYSPAQSLLDGPFSQNYGLYGFFTGSGTYTTAGDTATFTLASGSFSMFVDPDSNTVFDTSGPASALSTYQQMGSSVSTDDYKIAFGSLVTGAGYQDCIGAVLCGSFETDVTFELTTPEGKSFFVAPDPFYNLSFQTGQFQAIDVAFNGNAIRNTTDGTLDATFGRIPEPASLALLGIGILGMGATRRIKV